MSIMVSLTNPLLLLFEFVTACIPIYAFTANYFYNKGIKLSQPCKHGLKDWIKVNAYVSFVFSVFIFFVCLLLIVAMNDAKLVKQMENQVKITYQIEIPAAQLLKYLRGSVMVLLPFSILLAIHIIITFRLIKKYSNVFSASVDNP